MKYKHLSLEERHYIEVESKKGVSMNKISNNLCRSQSTISREIKRNTGFRGYRYKQANILTKKRHLEKRKQIKLNSKIKHLINLYIKKDWSPEQIGGRLKKENIIQLHHESIYKYILKDKELGGNLYKHLRHKSKPYKKRYGSLNRREAIPNRVDIDERPEAANDRTRLGDWEADTIIGKQHKGAIVTLDERFSKLRLAAPTEGKKASSVTNAITWLLEPINKFVHTITFDNGKEFTNHEDIADTIGCKTYFAKPYHSWERGQNENANGLLRQYFPKSMKLVNISNKKVFTAIDKLNSRPRKCLGYKTPYEVFKPTFITLIN